jgi:ankyrin repeat protein
MSINDTFLDAVKNNKLDTVKALIAVKDSINLDINAKALDGWTSLMSASWKGHKEIVELLLKNGADINAKNSDGWTALMSASWKGHKEIVELLLENGADINAKNSGGWTALMLASNNGHSEAHQAIVELLLMNGADIEAKNLLGWTALMSASWYGRKEIVKILENASAAVAAKAKAEAKTTDDPKIFAETSLPKSYTVKVPVGINVNFVSDPTVTEVTVVSN